jgi:hypothetical protein
MKLAMRYRPRVKKKVRLRAAFLVSSALKRKKAALSPARVEQMLALVHGACGHALDGFSFSARCRIEGVGEMGAAARTTSALPRAGLGFLRPRARVTSCGRRNAAAWTFSRLKRVRGWRLRSRSIEARRAEARIAADGLNWMVELGLPRARRVA